MTTTQIDRDTATQAVAQFVALTHARLKGDGRAEREAIRELRRLGVTVIWEVPRRD